MIHLKIFLRRCIGRLVYRYFVPKAPPLDWILKCLDEQMDPVTFIQIGANDGITGDDAARFKRKENWQGILLEPQSEAFAKLEENFPEDRYVNLNFAIGEKTETRDLYKLNFTDERWANGLASFRKETLADHFKDGYIRQKAARQQIEIPEDANPDDWIAAVPVSALSYADLLARKDFQQINVIFIDVEGFDYEILKMINYEPEELKLVVFENKHLSPADAAAAEALLTAHRFRVFHCGVNSIALRGMWIPLTWSVTA